MSSWLLQVFFSAVCPLPFGSFRATPMSGSFWNKNDASFLVSTCPKEIQLSISLELSSIAPVFYGFLQRSSEVPPAPRISLYRMNGPAVLPRCHRSLQGLLEVDVAQRAWRPMWQAPYENLTCTNQNLGTLSIFSVQVVLVFLNLSAVSIYPRAQFSLAFHANKEYRTYNIYIYTHFNCLIFLAICNTSEPANSLLLCNMF